MHINFKLNKNFATTFNKLCEKYGEEFEFLNSVHKTQLDDTEFIDHFTADNKNISDNTIDPNANQKFKDIVSLRAEKGKSRDKLLAMNKIFYEVQKEYGFQTAKEFLEDEWSGATYLNDFVTASFIPYCIMPEECCAFILNGKKIYSSLERIYELLEEDEYHDTLQDVLYKKPKNLRVLDYDKESGTNRYTKVTMISTKETDKDFYFTKLKNGSNIITTEDHKFISKEDDIEAQSITSNDIFYSSWDKDLFTNSLDTYNGFELNEDFGYLVGMFLSEGYAAKNTLVICQSFTKSREEWDRIVSILKSLNLSHYTNTAANRIYINAGKDNVMQRLLSICQGYLCDSKRLTEDFVNFNDEFLKGFLAGIIDGDGTIANNRTCMIRLTSKTLINQIRLIGLHFGIYFGSRIPYIQEQKGDIKQKRPMYACNVNMNRNRELFLSLKSRKIKEKFTHFKYDERFATKGFCNDMGEIGVSVCGEQTYKQREKVFDLSTETHTFICNEILIHNCYSYDLTRLCTEGLFMLGDSYNNLPPKHLDTFNDDVVEYVSWNANRTSGRNMLCPFISFPLTSGVAYAANGES